MSLQQWFKTIEIAALLIGSVAGAYILQWVLTRVILVATRRTATDLDNAIVTRVSGPLFWSLLLSGIYYALARYDPDASWVATTASVFKTIAVLIWTRALMHVTDKVFAALARKADRFEWINARSLPLLDIVGRLVLLGGAVYIMLKAWSLNPGPFLASAGVMGIALGFAAKDTLANLFAGIFILADAPYKLGDFIVIDSGERGMVTDIGIRSTRLLTREDIEITLPNAVMGNAKIMNETGGPHERRRVGVAVGVAYGSDVDQVRAVLTDVAVNCEVLAKDPAPRVRFRSMGDSALNFELQAWINSPIERGSVIDRLNTDIYKRLNKENIEIPFPQRVVHMVKE